MFVSMRAVGIPIHPLLVEFLARPATRTIRQRSLCAQGEHQRVRALPRVGIGKRRMCRRLFNLSLDCFADQFGFADAPLTCLTFEQCRLTLLKIHLLANHHCHFALLTHQIIPYAPSRVNNKKTRQVSSTGRVLILFAAFALQAFAFYFGIPASTSNARGFRNRGSQELLSCATRCSSHFFSERWLSPEDLPKIRFSTLMSSSKSGQ